MGGPSYQQPAHPPPGQDGKRKFVLPPFDPAKLPPALRVQKKKSTMEIQRMAKKRWYERSKINGQYQRDLEKNRLRRQVDRQVKSARKRAMNNSNNRTMMCNNTKATNRLNHLVDAAELSLGVDKAQTKESGMGDNLKWFAYVAASDMNCAKKK